MLDAELYQHDHEVPPPRRQNHIGAWVLGILAVLAVHLSLLI